MVKNKNAAEDSTSKTTQACTEPQQATVSYINRS